MPNSNPNSPAEQPKSQPAAPRKFDFQSPVNPRPVLRHLSMGDEDFEIEAPELCAPHAPTGTAQAHGGFAPQPPQPQGWTLPPAHAPVGFAPALPGQLNHGRPQLAPLDTGMAMGSPYGDILQDFETLIMVDSHGRHAHYTSQPSLEAEPSQDALEAALIGCNLDDTRPPSNAMAD